MKKLVCAVLIVVMLTVCSLPVFAKGAGISAPANSVMDNATGKIGILYIHTLDSYGKAFINDYLATPANYQVSFTNTTVDFIKWRSALNGYFSYSANGLAMQSSATLFGESLSFDIFTGLPTTTGTSLTSIQKGANYRPNLVGYNPYLKAGYPMSTYNYIWTPVNNSPEGNYWVNFSDKEEPPVEPEKPNEGGGILDWLKNFWDDLLKFLKDLFVPPDGYFENWFKEIQDAFTKKMGGLGDLFAYIQSSFEGLKDGSQKGSIKLELPKDFLYKGYDGVSAEVLSGHIAPMLAWLRGILTAIIIVITSITCIRKVIALVNC